MTIEEGKTAPEGGTDDVHMIEARFLKSYDLSISDFKYELQYRGIVVEKEQVIPDGKIRHNEQGAFQLLQGSEGFMFGRWRKWADPKSYNDGWSNAVRELHFSKVEDRRNELYPCYDKWKQEWADYISENEIPARLAAWSSDRVISDYSKQTWAVYQFIAAGSVAWIYGAPGSLKTFTALDIACRVATGSEWCGRKTKQGPVLYISAEGGRDIHFRRKAWEVINGPAPMLKIVNECPLIDEGNLHGIEAHIEDIKEVTGEPPAMLFIDTYAQTSTGDTKEVVSAYIRKLQALLSRKAPGCAVVVIDHATKEGNTWMGSLAKLGNIDLMAMAHKKGDVVTLTMRGGKGKIRGAADFDDIKLKAEPVGIGVTDEIGEEISTLVVKPAGRDHGRAERLILETIGEGISYGDLRAKFAEADMNRDAKAATVRGRLSRALDQLETLDEIEVEGKDDASIVRPK